ncbi:50S ribosomal protein L30 [Candidatus Woesearchaeota archaeon]|nr:50S ribosomal protein L30 [Candidatus Woesearchaeota archaeon]
MIEEIKKNLKTKKLVIGTDSTIKNLRLSKLSKVFLSRNAPKNVISEIEAAAKLTNTSVEQLNVDSDELGAVCKKSFNISILGLLK